MEKEIFSENANERSCEAMPQTVKSAKAGKSTNRSYFSRAKQKTIDMYRKVYSTGFLETEEQKSAWLLQCLKKTLDSMKGYNEEGFRKDLSMRMARLINDKRFDRSCKRAEKCLYEEAQRLAWASEKVFQQILSDGIDKVKGFYTPYLVIFPLEKIKQDLLFNDVDPKDLDGRYSKEWYKSHPEAVEGNPAKETKQDDGLEELLDQISAEETKQESESVKATDAA